MIIILITDCIAMDEQVWIHDVYNTSILKGLCKKKYLRVHIWNLKKTTPHNHVIEKLSTLYEILIFLNFSWYIQLHQHYLH